MKTLRQKRDEALERLKNYKWEDSKAARLGTRTKEQWDKAQKKLKEKLESL